MNCTLNMSLRIVFGFFGFLTQWFLASSDVEWKQLDFLFPSFGERMCALNQSRFIPMNNIPFDVDVDYRGKLGQWNNINYVICDIFASDM